MAEAIPFDLIGRIYRASIGNEAWATAFDHLSEILGGRRTTFHRFCAPRGRPETGLRLLPTPAADRSRPPPPQLPIGSVFLGGMPVPGTPGAGIGFYHEVLKPWGLLSGLYWLSFDPHRSAAALTLWRPPHGSGWSEEQLLVLRCLAPHLDCALAIERRLAAAHRAAGALPLAPPALTQRERDCLLLVARGASNKEAARRLGLSIYTVEGHIKSAIRKLQATSRTGAVATALALGLLNG
ncbi:response regulator transcription factor [Inquilinus sp. CA228]|uniref:response regulator transcription factor n=1 Tax=Inquilinus sp. CA228 TaxID=3455609 RepID=UPI003F8CF7C7